MKYEYVIFDLDGTIAQSGKGVLDSLSYALGKIKIPMPADIPDNMFMGPPLSFSLREYCHVPESKMGDAVRIYREYYDRTGILECDPYVGVYEMTEELSAAGKKLIVASSKPEKYVRRIMERFGISRFFVFMGGSDSEGTRSEKDDVMKYAMKSAGVSDTGKTVMIGDRKYDILGAKSLGLDSIGVTYGYGSRSELVEAGATYVADTPSEITKIILTEE